MGSHLAGVPVDSAIIPGLLQSLADGGKSATTMYTRFSGGGMAKKTSSGRFIVTLMHD